MSANIMAIKETFMCVLLLLLFTQSPYCGSDHIFDIHEHRGQRSITYLNCLQDETKILKKL